MNSAARDAGFIGGGLAKVFAMTYAPPEAARVARCYVVAPAFGEEMNRSRDLLRVFGHTAADRGAATVIPDLRGTGDSPGQFGAFDAAAWCDDLSLAIAHARERFPHAGITLLGLRFGALLAARVMAAAGVRHMLLWQPVTDGRRFMREFLRVWSAANMDARETPREWLERHGSIEIAGYRVDTSFVQNMESLTLDGSDMPTAAIDWVEAAAALSPRSERVVAALRDAGHDVRTALADSPPFWRVQERVDASGFIAASGLNDEGARTDG